MKKKSLAVAAALLTCALAPLLNAGTPEEKAFVDKYKTAVEAGDKAALESLLYTKGAHPMALEFYKMMITSNAGSKVTSIELVDLSPEDATKAAAVEEGPGGEKVKFPIKPTKKLKFKVETKDGDSTSSSSSECFVAEDGGKFVVPVPAPAK